MIEVPLAAPQNAKIVNRPRIFADEATGAIAGLWPGGDHGEGTQRTSTTNQCHDITVYPEIGLAAGACSGNGILMDIKDPKNPEAARPRRRQELRLLALGDVQQRRHQDHLHRRMGRRHASAVPRDRPAHLGRRRGLRHRRRQEAEVRRLLTRCRRRRPIRRTASRTTDRSSRFPGATSWCRRGIRAGCRCSTSPTRPSRSRSRTSIAARSTPRT